MLQYDREEQARRLYFALKGLAVPVKIGTNVSVDLGDISNRSTRSVNESFRFANAERHETPACFVSWASSALDANAEAIMPQTAGVGLEEEPFGPLDGLRGVLEELAP